ncbi:uncharacterized protein LOC110049762 [Orbicella faveolata]|uniref:uncharacterized protein LOC110049762 n=1 Tax=Orbicella faveolata TaxID=48498 RepID=UPI0009E36B09|nr:uncharacterized protein LOC110049762 [Orbicella faveolata]
MSSDSAYERARNLLDECFGNPIHVTEAYKSSLRSWPKINDGDSSGIQEFSDFLIRCEEAMKTMQSMGDLNSTETLRLVSSKLPSYSGVKWCWHAHEAHTKSKKIVTFEDFARFIKDKAELVNDPIFSPNALKAERRKSDTPFKMGRRTRPSKGDSSSSASAFAVSSTQPPDNFVPPSKPPAEQTDQTCPLCNSQHTLVKCNKFLKKSVDDRSEFLQNKGLCYGCFGKGLMSSGCRNRATCKECGRHHHTLLHIVNPNNQQPDSKLPATPQASNKKETPSEKSPPSDTANSNLISVVNNSSSEPGNVITNCRIVQVVLFHKESPLKTVKVYALLDDASDTTFVTTQMQHKLNIEGVETCLDLCTMLGRKRLAVKRVDGLVVQRLNKCAQVELPKAYARESILSRRDQIPRPETANNWPHLMKIKDKIPLYDDKVEIGLLIGCNCPKAIKPTEVVKGKSEEPYAVRTLLGWSIVGPVTPTGTPVDDHAIDSTCHRTLAREIIPGSLGGELSDEIVKGRTSCWHSPHST